MSKLFVYGVLMYPELLMQLLGKSLNLTPATLPGHQRYTLDMDDWPKIPVVVPEAGSQVAGALIEGVDAASIEILDAFEEVDLGLYRRVVCTVQQAQGDETDAFAYLGTPMTSDALSGIWCERDFIAAHYASYRDDIIPGFLAEMRHPEDD